MEPDDIERLGEEQANRVAYLVAGYIRQTLTEKEHDELDDWITSSDENQVLFEELTDPDFIKRGLDAMKKADAEAVRERIQRKISFKDKRVVEGNRKWISYGIAASLILLAGLTIFFMTNKKAKPTKEIVQQNGINPGGNYATLTLANGRTINLVDVKNGLLDSTNGNEVLKTADGQISYENVSNELMKYHVLSTPAGGQYSVTLPDGSRVWLNSLSSLKYPVVFAANERVVELSGEGYFEVAPLTSPGLKAAPSKGGQKVTFIVKVNGMKVEVLGTHFNINAYADEPVVRTVLLEGKVVVSSEVGRSESPEDQKTGSQELVPGQQARVDKRGGITVSSEIDVDEAVAWKNGMFMFKDLPIEGVMRQVARWYGAEIVYEGKVDHHFNATIYRKESIEKLLHVLEETGEVYFRVEGRKVIVSR